jgi:hypothetical protein
MLARRAFSGRRLVSNATVAQRRTICDNETGIDDEFQDLANPIIGFGFGEWSYVVSRSLKVERAMGIEPTRRALPGLENKRFAAMANTKCD